jgi:hypothetical protein
MTETVVVLASELAELRQNAARYLWLRDQLNLNASDMLYFLSGSALDNEIDWEMQENK